MAGWGLTQQAGQLAGALQELDVHVLDARMCNNSRFWKGSITHDMICLEAKAKDQAPCKVRGSSREARQPGLRGGQKPRPGGTWAPVLSILWRILEIGTSITISQIQKLRHREV